MSQIEIYKKLKLLRKERGLTLNELAEKVGGDYQQISRIERGKSKLSIDLLLKMANALDAPISDLVKQPLPSKTQAPSEDKDLLATILEKIECALQKEKLSLSPSVKASVVSQIYNQAQAMQQAKVHKQLIEDFISFSTHMIKTVTGEVKK